MELPRVLKQAGMWEEAAFVFHPLTPRISETSTS